jgi:hypothetical protein
MNNKILAGIAAGLLTVAALVTVGVVAYNAGERSDRAVVTEVVSDGEGTARTVLVPADGHWHGGWRGPGFGPGFLVFPLIVTGLVLFFASRRASWRGPRGYPDDELQAWHRRQHGDDTAPPVGPGT